MRPDWTQMGNGGKMWEWSIFPALFWFLVLIIFNHKQKQTKAHGKTCTRVFMCMSAFKIIFYFSFSFCHLFGILCTSMFSSKPICICIANIHFHFGFMCLPSLLIGFGSFPNVQSVPSNNYIPKEICMNFVTEFDGLPACHRRDSDILLHVKAKCQQDIIRQRERESLQRIRIMMIL